MIMISVRYEPHLVSLVIQIGTTGVTTPTNFELRQSVRLSSPAVSCDSLQFLAWPVMAASDDKLALRLNTTGLTV